NLNVIRRVTDRVAVMYLGQLFEEGPTADLFARPGHPYTAALIAANPAIDPQRRRQRVVLRGEIPSPLNPPQGCRFHTRCPIARDICRSAPPVVARAGGGAVACHFPESGR
ncbi:MAG: ABC transporter ATP-binding protein, partial [Alphaproteobacteria bacterium]|nr:ABC transporter ATP-binding protein [Alphaproteobacteria bacterium]